MIPDKIKDANAMFGAPKEWNDEKTGVHCQTLHVKTGEDANGNHVIVSAWIPSPEEIEAIKNGHAVILIVYGYGHPAVTLGVSSENYQTPRHLVMNCPRCGIQHIDQNEWATKQHKTHQCQACGFEWRPYDYPTFGVEGEKS